jgi:hypothetical protein
LRQPSKPFESATPDYQSTRKFWPKPAYQYFYIRAGAFGINRFGLALNVVGGGLGRMPAKV